MGIYGLLFRSQMANFPKTLLLGAAHMSRASPANRTDSILSRPMVA